MDWRAEAEEDRHWEEAAFRWVLGLGAAVGAWWTLLGLQALEALADGRWPAALAALVLASLPNLAWHAARRGHRAAASLRLLRAVWRASAGRGHAGTPEAPAS